MSQSCCRWTMLTIAPSFLALMCLITNHFDHIMIFSKTDVALVVRSLALTSSSFAIDVSILNWTQTKHLRLRTELKNHQQHQHLPPNHHFLQTYLLVVPPTNEEPMPPVHVQLRQRRALMVRLILLALHVEDLLLIV